MKELVIYHADCTDGFAAAYVAWTVLGDSADYIPMHYADASPDYVADLCYDRKVYILDFSFRKPVMEHIFKTANTVVWLDHHKTAFNEWGEGSTYTNTHTWLRGPFPCNVGVVLDNHQSGAMLAWNHFRPNETAPALIRHIDDRDRWQFELDGSKEIHAALSSRKPWSFKVWDEWMNSRSNHQEMIAEGKVLCRTQDAHIRSILKSAVACVIDSDDNLPGAAVNSIIFQSEIGHRLAERSGTYGLVWYLGNNGRAKCSLRSVGDYDVSEVAKMFGGGGHKNAAGFEVGVSRLLGWLK